MPASVFDKEVRDIILEAETKKSEKTVTVHGKRITITKPFPSPMDWRDQFLYYIMVDRFDDNSFETPSYRPDIASKISGHKEGSYFQGGNLKGIIRRLDYIQELGCTAIWLSPVMKNSQQGGNTYHGFNTQGFLDVDPRFGTLEDLQELTSEAHARDLFVILDATFNPSSDILTSYFKLKGDDEGWAESKIPVDPLDPLIYPLELLDEKLYYKALDKTFQFECFYKIIMDYPDVQDIFIQIYKYWIASTDIDGLHIGEIESFESDGFSIICNTIHEFTKKIGKHNFLICGNMMDNEFSIEKYARSTCRIFGSYWGFPTLDACLNFQLQLALETVIKGDGEPTVLQKHHEILHKLFSDHGLAGRYFLTFIDDYFHLNGPCHRFLNQVSNQNLVMLAIGYILTSHGIPSILYGTEQGFDGGGTDADMHECMFGGQWGGFGTTGMHFFNPENSIYQFIRTIAMIRRREPALRYGRQYFREISSNGVDFYSPTAEDSLLAYSRILSTKEVLVVLNLHEFYKTIYVTVDKNLSLPGNIMCDILNNLKQHIQTTMDGRNVIKVWLPPYSMSIMKASDEIGVLENCC